MGKTEFRDIVGWEGFTVCISEEEKLNNEVHRGIYIT